MIWRWLRGDAERCHACRAAPVQRVVAVDDLGEPGYRICRACKGRLLEYSLRPLEWYNLAVRYGPTRGLLHDDLYTEDGIAEQPKEFVVDRQLFPAPRLDEVRGDLERLIDYRLSQYRTDDAIRDALAAHDADAMLASFDRRLAESMRADLEDVLLDICATVLGRKAEAWVRGRWEGRTGATSQLIRASASCLTHSEAFDRATAGLAAMPERMRPWSALAYFRSEKTLDWIEQNVQRPVTPDWGVLAAQSQLTWERAARWLDAGRPMSLVALDGLVLYTARCIEAAGEQPPELAGPVAAREMIDRLKLYARTDPAHRVETTVRVIVSQLERIPTSEPGVNQ